MLSRLCVDYLSVGRSVVLWCPLAGEMIRKGPNGVVLLHGSATTLTTRDSLLFYGTTPPPMSNDRVTADSTLPSGTKDSDDVNGSGDVSPDSSASISGDQAAYGGASLNPPLSAPSVDGEATGIDSSPPTAQAGSFNIMSNDRVTADSTLPPGTKDSDDVNGSEDISPDSSASI